MCSSPFTCKDLEKGYMYHITKHVKRGDLQPSSFVPRSIWLHTLKLTTEVCRLIKTQDIAFTSEDKADLCTARTHMSRTIGKNPQHYAQIIHSHFLNTNNTWPMRQEIQAIMNYKTALHVIVIVSVMVQVHWTISLHGSKHRTTCRQDRPHVHWPSSLSVCGWHQEVNRFNPQGATAPDSIPVRYSGYILIGLQALKDIVSISVI